jgi:hypothetical protein
VLGYVALRSLARLRRATALLTRGMGDATTGHESLAELAHRTVERTALLEEQLAELRAQVARTGGAVTTGPASVGSSQGALRNVALVRYDAFTEMSGRLSFSLALLNEDGDGVAVSAIAARTDTRVYAKGVRSGVGEQDLTPEERQAVSAALSGERGRRAVRRRAG